MCRSCNNSPIVPPIAADSVVESVVELRPVVIGAQIGLPFWVAGGEHTGGYDQPEIEKRDRNGDKIPIELIACSNCGAECEADKLTDHINGEDKLCGECAISCEECGAIHSVDDDDIGSAHSVEGNRRNRREQTRCDNCRWECADCGDYFYGSACSNAGDEDICLSCAENYISCEECNATIHIDDSRYDGDNERTLCVSCYDERERSNSRCELVRDYSYKPHPLFQSAIGEKIHPLNPYYGIELECETDKSGDGYDHDSAITDSGLASESAFYVKHDGSLADSGKAGFEIVSHPATLKWWIEKDLSFCRSLQRKGYDGTANCGMHIHVSRSALSTSQIAKLLHFVGRNRPVFTYLSRRESAETMSTYAPIRPHSVQGSIDRAYRGNTHSERYSAINLENKNTIEFRFFQGTLNPSHIKRNIALCAILIDFIRVTPLSRLAADDMRSHILKCGKGIVGGELSRALVQWIDESETSYCAA